MSYAIEILRNELDLLKSNVKWVEDPASVRYYKTDDVEDLARWKSQITELEGAIKKLKC